MDTPILFYDGHCALCNGTVKRIIHRDKNRVFKFAPLQGDTAKQLLAKHPEVKDVDSIIILNGDQTYIYSNAVRFICLAIPFYKYTVWPYYLLPRFIRDGIYKTIAKVRYKTFGKYDTCPMPPEAWRSRFLP